MKTTPLTILAVSLIFCAGILLPAFGQQIRTGVMRDRDVSHQKFDRQIVYSGFAEESFCFGPRRVDVVREARKRDQLGFGHRPIRSWPHEAADIFQKRRPLELLRRAPAIDRQ